MSIRKPVGRTVSRHSCKPCRANIRHMHAYIGMRWRKRSGREGGLNIHGPIDQVQAIHLPPTHPPLDQEPLLLAHSVLRKGSSNTQQYNTRYQSGTSRVQQHRACKCLVTAACPAILIYANPFCQLHATKCYTIRMATALTCTAPQTVQDMTWVDCIFYQQQPYSQHTERDLAAHHPSHTIISTAY
jgi:hypothetical protein